MVRFAIVVSAVVVAAALLPSLAGRAEAQNSIINGLVLDVDGNPIVGAEVVAENTQWQRRLEETTNTAGRFSFIGLQRGRWLFVVRRRGYEPVQGFANASGVPGRIGFVMETDPFHPPAPTTGVLANIRGDEIQEALDDADLLFDNGDYDGAIAAYEALLVRVPALTGLHIQIGHAYREKNDLDQALAAYRAVPDHDPASGEAQAAIEALQAGDGDR